MEDSNGRRIPWALFVSERPGVELVFFDRGMNLSPKGGG